MFLVHYKVINHDLINCTTRLIYIDYRYSENMKMLPNKKFTFFNKCLMDEIIIFDDK